MPDFTNQNPTRRGNTEFINVGQRQRAVRTWDAAASKWVYTRLGKTYFKTLRVEYVVNIPVLIHGHRQNHTSYTRETMMPVETLGLGRMFAPATLEHHEAQARLKAQVLASLHGTETEQGLLLYQFSEELWYLDTSRDWVINSMETLTRPGHISQRPR